MHYLRYRHVADMEGHWPDYFKQIKTSDINVGNVMGKLDESTILRVLEMAGGSMLRLEKGL